MSALTTKSKSAIGGLGIGVEVTAMTKTEFKRAYRELRTKHTFNRNTMDALDWALFQKLKPQRKYVWQRQDHMLVFACMKALRSVSLR